MYEKKFFLLKTEWEQIFSTLSDEDAGLLIKQIFTYHNKGFLNEMENKVLNALFSMMRIEFEIMEQKYNYGKSVKSVSNNTQNIGAPVGNSNAKKEKKKFGDSVFLTEKEYNTLIEKYGEKQTQCFIERLDNYKCAHGKEYTSDYKAILSWVIRAIEENGNYDKKSGGIKFLDANLCLKRYGAFPSKEICRVEYNGQNAIVTLEDAIKNNLKIIRRYDGN